MATPYKRTDQGHTGNHQAVAVLSFSLDAIWRKRLYLILQLSFSRHGLNSNEIPLKKIKKS